MSDTQENPNKTSWAKLPKERKRVIIRKNLLFLTAIGGLFFGWYRLQFNTYLNTEQQDVRLPGYTIKVKEDPGWTEESTNLRMIREKLKKASRFAKIFKWTKEHPVVAFMAIFSVVTLLNSPIVETWSYQYAIDRKKAREKGKSM